MTALELTSALISAAPELGAHRILETAPPAIYRMIAESVAHPPNSPDDVFVLGGENTNEREIQEEHYRGSILLHQAIHGA